MKSIWEGHWYIYWLPHGGPEKYSSHRHHHYELNSEGAKGVFGPHLLYDFTGGLEDNPKTLPRRLDTTHIDDIHAAFLKAYKKQRGIDLVWERQSYP